MLYGVNQRFLGAGGTADRCNFEPRITVLCLMLEFVDKSFPLTIKLSKPGARISLRDTAKWHIVYNKHWTQSDLYHPAQEANCLLETSTTAVVHQVGVCVWRETDDCFNFSKNLSMLLNKHDEIKGKRKFLCKI